MSSNSFHIVGFSVNHILSHFFRDAEAGYSRTGKSAVRCSVQKCQVIIIWEKETKALAAHQISESPSGSIRRHKPVGFCSPFQCD